MAYAISDLNSKKQEKAIKPMKKITNDQRIPMSWIYTLGACFILAVVAASPAVAKSDKGASRVPDAIWADGELYDTIGTPTEFKDPPPHSTDVLYNFAGSGLAGQRSVSVAAPGDTDYNGGRWAVTPVTFTDTGIAKYGDGDGNIAENMELMSAEEVTQAEEDDFLEIANEPAFYFECPLLRSKDN